MLDLICTHLFVCFRSIKLFTSNFTSFRETFRQCREVKERWETD